MEVLIFGCGRLTLLLVPDLLQKGHEVAVLAPETEGLGRLPDHPRIESILTAEPLMHDYLRQARIASADVVLALSADDHRNILVSQIAQHIFNVPSVICHLDRPDLQQLYQELGLRVVGPSGDLLEDIQRLLEN